MGEKEAKLMGLPPLLDPLGPWPVKDVMGMKTAIVMLKRSLQKGKNEEHVQFGTVRKLQGFVTNGYQAGSGGLHDQIGGYEQNKL